MKSEKTCRRVAGEKKYQSRAQWKHQGSGRKTDCMVSRSRRAWEFDLDPI